MKSLGDDGGWGALLQPYDAYAFACAKEDAGKDLVFLWLWRVRAGHRQRRIGTCVHWPDT
jgi:hypothetical protein